jgi:hypothetical protein
VIANPEDGTLSLTVDQWQNFISPDMEDNRGYCIKVGVNETVVGFRAPVIELDVKGGLTASITAKGNDVTSYVLHGQGQLQGCYPTGISLEGTVTVGNRKRKAHSGSVLCRLPDGSLLRSVVIVLDGSTIRQVN